MSESSEYMDISFNIRAPVAIKIVPFLYLQRAQLGFPGGIAVKNLPANAGDMGLIPGLGRFPGVGSGNPLQYSCLENPVDRGAWQGTVHEVTRSWTPLNN